MLDFVILLRIATIFVLIVTHSTSTRAIELHCHTADELSVVSLSALNLLICLIDSCISVLLRCRDRVLIGKLRPLLILLRS